jgi:hypothetical protein
LDLLGQFRATGTHLEQRSLAIAESVGECGDFAAASRGVGLERGDLGAAIAELLGMPGEVKMCEAMA